MQPSQNLIDSDCIHQNFVVRRLCCFDTQSLVKINFLQCKPGTNVGDSIYKDVKALSLVVISREVERYAQIVPVYKIGVE